MSASNLSSRPDTGFALDEELRIREPRRPGRFIVMLVVAFLVFMFAQALATSEAMHWPEVARYLFNPQVMDGLAVTLQLTVISAVIGLVGGTILASMRLSNSYVLRAVSGFYIWFMRGTPLLVQLLFFYFLATIFPRLGIGIPYGPTFWSWDTNMLITPFMAAVLAFGFNEAAYMAEIVRAGLISVPEGQVEAAVSIGLNQNQVFRKVKLPQAMRIIVPPMVNQMIKLLKETSIVILVAIPDLLTSVQNIYNQNFLQIPLLVVASIWYLLVTTIFSILQGIAERHYGRGYSRRRAVRTSRQSAAAHEIEESANSSEPEVKNG